MVKILAIGDFHGKLPTKLKKEAKKADLILSTGDFGGSDKLLNVVFKYFYSNWWKEVGKKKTRQYIMEDYNSGKKMIQELNNLKTPIFYLPSKYKKSCFKTIVNPKIAGQPPKINSKINIRL